MKFLPFRTVSKPTLWLCSMTSCVRTDPQFCVSPWFRLKRIVPFIGIQSVSLIATLGS